MIAKIVTWYNYLHMYPDGYVKNGIDLTDVVFYVGKGQKARIDEHEKEARTDCECNKCEVIREIWLDGYPVKKRIVFETLVESDALKNEKSLIALHASEYLTNIVHNKLTFQPRKKSDTHRLSVEGLSKQEANILRSLEAKSDHYEVAGIQHIRGRVYTVTMKGEHYKAVVLSSSYLYYELQYHIARQKPEMIICHAHDTVVPIPVVSMKTGKIMQKYELPEEVTDIEEQRFTKTGCRVLLGMYLSGVRYAQDLVKTLPDTTKARYLQKAKDLSHRRRGRPVDTQKQNRA